jgi:hypothetical protein
MGAIGSYQRLSEAHLLSQGLACELLGPFVRRLEEVAHKVTGGTWIGCRAEG